MADKVIPSLTASLFLSPTGLLRDADFLLHFYHWRQTKDQHHVQTFIERLERASRQVLPFSNLTAAHRQVNRLPSCIIHTKKLSWLMLVECHVANIRQLSLFLRCRFCTLYTLRNFVGCSSKQTDIFFAMRRSRGDMLKNKSKYHLCGT